MLLYVRSENILISPKDLRQDSIELKLLRLEVPLSRIISFLFTIEYVFDADSFHYLLPLKTKVQFGNK